MTVQPTDTYIVNRGGTNYKVPAADIGSKLQPSDFMLVNRSGTNYKVTGADLTNQLDSSQSPCAQGGIVFKDRNNWWHLFYESGTFKINNSTNFMRITAFGGGGGGGSNTGGGGGGGGVQPQIVFPVVPGPRIVTVTIGAGGAGGPYPGASNGQNGGTTQVTNLPQSVFAGGGGGGGGGSNSGVSQPTGTGGGGGGNTTSSTPSGGSGRPTWPANGAGGNGYHLAGGGGGGYLSVPSGGTNSKNAPTLANAGNNGFNPNNQPFVRAGDGSRGGGFISSVAGFGAGGGGGRNGPYVGYGGGNYPPQYSTTHISGGHGKSPLTPVNSTKLETSNGEIYTGSGGGGGAQQNKGGNGSGGVVLIFYPRINNISNAPSTLRENPNIN